MSKPFRTVTITVVVKDNLDVEYQLTSEGDKKGALHYAPFASATAELSDAIHGWLSHCAESLSREADSAQRHAERLRKAIAAAMSHRKMPVDPDPPKREPGEDRGE